MLFDFQVVVKLPSISAFQFQNPKSEMIEIGLVRGVEIWKVEVEMVGILSGEEQNIGN